MNTKTLTLSEVIKHLREIKRDAGGNIPVFLSSDEEGNSYGALQEKYSFAVDDVTKPSYLVLYPLGTVSDNEFEEVIKSK